MDELDSAMSAPAGGTLDSLMDGYVANKGAALRASATLAVDANPDEVARQKRIASLLGQPLAAVQALPKESERSAKVDHLDTATRDAPVLRQKYTDVDFAKLAHDDAGTLAPLEGVVSAIKYLVSAPGQEQGLMRDIGATGYRVARQSAGLQRAVEDTLASGLGGITLGQHGDGIQMHADQMGRLADYYGKQADAMSSKWAPDSLPAQILGGGTTSGVQSAVQTMGVGALALWLLGPEFGIPATAALLAAGQGGESYQKAREQGAGKLKSLAYGAEDAAAEYIGERYFGAAGFLQKAMAGASAKKLAMYEITREIPGEGGTTVWQNFNEWMNLNPEKSVSEFMNEQPAAIAQTIVATLVGGGGQIAVTKALDGALSNMAADYRKAAQADQAAQLLDQMTKLAQASKLRERDPESFQSFIKEALEDGPVSDVYVDAEVLHQSGLGEKLAQVSPSVAEQLPIAAATGGMVRIPVEEYATVIAPSEYHQSLIDHLKLDADGMSRSQAQEYLTSQGEELKTLVEQVMAEKEGDTVFKQSADAVKEQIKTQLDKLNRFTSDVHEQYATLASTFYAVTAAKLGFLPQDLFALHPLQVAAERIMGDAYGQSESIERVRKLWDEAGISHTLSEKNGVITVSKIVVPEANRGAGKGTAALKALADYADQTGQHIALSPSSDFGGNKKRLTAFYKRFGFVENKGKNRAFSTSETMYRQASGKVLYQRSAPSLKSFANLGNGFTVADGKLLRNGSAVGDLALEVVAQENGNPHLVVKNIHIDSKGQGTGTMALAQIMGRASEFDLPVEVESPDGMKPYFKRLGFTGEKVLRWEPRQFMQPDGGGATARGAFNPASKTITLLKGADLSTFLHELGHFFLEMQFELSSELGAKESLSAPQQEMVADSNALLAWFGLRDLAEWHGLPFEEKRAYHEKFAESFEAYLFSGKAPSIELNTLFQRVRAWMTRVYDSLKQFLTLHPAAGELSDEVRTVFDRMLATNEQIALAEQARAMLPLFQTPEQAGMTPEEFAKYHAQGVDATNEAVQELQAKGLRDLQYIARIKSREIKRLMDEAKELRNDIRQEVRRDVMARPVYQAWQFLTGKEEVEGHPVGKLNRDALADMYGGAGDRYALFDWKRLTDLKMTAKDGMHPDMVADMFGFSSGDELVRTLSATEKPAVQVEAETDALMLQRHGELATPEAIELAAEESIHNEARARMVATELNALDKAMSAQAEGKTASGKPRKFAVLPAAAKEFARELISRLKVRDIKPSQYAHAAAKEARETEKSLKAGELEDAAAHKRNHLLNLYATMEANKARDEMTQARKYLRNLQKESVRKSIPSDYLGQIDALLGKFDLLSRSLKAVDRRLSLTAWVKSQINAGKLPDIAETLLSPAERAAYRAEIESRGENGELNYIDEEARLEKLADAVERSQQRPFAELTVEEVRGLVDTVRQIEHLGRVKDKLLKAKENKTYEEARDEIAESIASNAKNSGKNTRTATDWVGRKSERVADFLVSHIKAATWARVMDGGKDNGAMWRYLIRPANDASTWETSEKAKVTAKIMEIMEPVLKGTPAQDRYLSGQHFPTLGMSLNQESRLAILLNLGNESNMQRLLDGFGWTVERLQPVLTSYTSAEIRAAQLVWDLMESYKPLVAAKEMRVNGKEPKWIQARPLTLKSAEGDVITLRGGYYPVKFDPRVSMKTGQHAKAQDAKMLTKLAYSVATTNRSYTVERVEEVHGRPLLLSLQGLYSGMNEVIHDLAWHETVIDMNRFLASEKIDEAIREHYGPEVKQQFEKWRDDIVMGAQRQNHALEGFASWMRQSISITAMAFNLVSAVLQPLGLAQSGVRIGWKWVGRGMNEYVGNPVAATREANQMSGWMANRARTRFRELNELRNRIEGQTKPRELVGQYGYWLMVKTQQMVDVITWHGAYQKAITDGHDEDRSIALADQAVKDAQGGGEEVDQAGIERGASWAKLFTMFYSFVGSQLNMAALSAMTERSRAKIAVDLITIIVIPAVLGKVLKNALTPGNSGDDGDDWWKKILAEVGSSVIGLVVGGREFSGAAKALFGEHQDYSGPAGLRLIPDSLAFAKQAGQAEFDDAFRKSLVNIIGDLTGLPSVQTNRTITGAKALAEGKTDNPMAIAFGYQEPR